LCHSLFEEVAVSEEAEKISGDLEGDVGFM
jgi:hypothetical protein